MNKKNMSLYLDHNATTPLCTPAQKAMVEAMDCVGNASSDHCLGTHVKHCLERKRKFICKLLGVEKGTIVFTSGATEGNNMIIQGMARKYPGSTFVSTRIEHPSVLNVMRYIKKAYNIKVVYVPVTSKGVVTLKAFEDVLKHHKNVSFCSIIYANHEIGTIQDISKLAIIAHKHGAVFHSDMTQAVGKIPVHLENLHVDAATWSAHKFYGCSGTGGLYMSNALLQYRPEQLCFGGNQELFSRPGTENLVGIYGMCAALDFSIKHMEKDAEKYEDLRHYMLEELKARDISFHLNGSQTKHKYIPSTVNIAFPHVNSAELVRYLSKKGICVSQGSACKAKSKEGSNVLKAIELPETYGVIRVGMGHSTTKHKIQRLVCEIENFMK